MIDEPCTCEPKDSFHCPPDIEQDSPIGFELFLIFNLLVTLIVLLVVLLIILLFLPLIFSIWVIFLVNLSLLLQLSLSKSFVQCFLRCSSLFVISGEVECELVLLRERLDCLDAKESIPVA